MGQYYNGVKIGTCENMYYMRLAQAQILANIGARDDDGIAFKEMLEDNTTRFRFPWPDEDGRAETNQLHNLMDFERGYKLQVPDGIEINHSTKWHTGNGYNVELPCIKSPEWARMAEAGAKLSHGTHPQTITVKYDAIRDGERAILFECSYCGQLQRSSREDWEQIVAYNEEMNRPPVRTSRHDADETDTLYKADCADYERRKEILERMKV